jgi:hypothetical protein
MGGSRRPRRDREQFGHDLRDGFRMSDVVSRIRLSRKWTM